MRLIAQLPLRRETLEFEFLSEVEFGLLSEAGELGIEEGVGTGVGGLLQGSAQLATEGEGERRGHRIPDLAVLAVHVSVEAEVVGEALQSCEW